MHWASFGALDELNDMAWTLPKFSKTEVDNAGTALASNDVSRVNFEIIDNGSQMMKHGAFDYGSVFGKGKWIHQ